MSIDDLQRMNQQAAPDDSEVALVRQRDACSPDMELVGLNFQ